MKGKLIFGVKIGVGTHTPMKDMTDRTVAPKLIVPTCEKCP